MNEFTVSHCEDCGKTYGYGTAENYGPQENAHNRWNDDEPLDSRTFDAAEDGLDGVIDLQDFCDRAGIELDLETRETSVYEFWPYKDLEMGP